MAATFRRFDKMDDAHLALEEAGREVKKHRIAENHREIYEAVLQEGLTAKLPDVIEERWRKCSVTCLGCNRDMGAVAVLTFTDAYSRKAVELTLCHDCLVKALVLVPEPVEERPWNWREQRAGR